MLPQPRLAQLAVHYFILSYFTWHCRVALEEQVKSLKRLVKDQSKTIQDLARRLNARNTHERRKHEREPVAPLDPVAEDHGARSALLC